MCRDTFDSAYSCRNHLAKAHQGLFSLSEIDAAVKICERATNVGTNLTCPICNKKVKSVKEYERHVGDEQEQLSLFALPKECIDDNDEEEDDDDAGEDEDEDESEDEDKGKGEREDDDNDSVSAQAAYPPLSFAQQRARTEGKKDKGRGFEIKRLRLRDPPGMFPFKVPKQGSVTGTADRQEADTLVESTP